MKSEKAADMQVSPGIKATAMPLVELSHISKKYGSTAVLKEISMVINSGKATALIGRNGSGKSTLLSILAGLLHVSSGHLHQRDSNMDTGYAPEVFPALKFTPEEFLRSMGRLHGFAHGDADQRIEELLLRFHLEGFRSRSMTSFSKGMLQKVNIMQSVLAKPQLLLLDEPMSGLDGPAQAALVQLVKELKGMGTAVVFSVHEPQWVKELADDVHVLQAGRTVRTLDRSELSGTSISEITYKGVAEQLNMEFRQLPGFLSWSLQKDHPEDSEPYSVLFVEAAHSDFFLRRILAADGSVLLVERRGGLAGLELWMSPKDSHKEGAES